MLRKEAAKKLSRDKYFNLDIELQQQISSISI